MKDFKLNNHDFKYMFSCTNKTGDKYFKFINCQTMFTKNTKGLVSLVSYVNKYPEPIDDNSIVDCNILIIKDIIE